MTQPLDIPTPEAAVQGIRSAFEHGDTRLAQRISQEAVAKFPDHPEMQHWAYLLAPPVVTVSKSPSDPDRHLNWDWLNENRDHYQGQWVAVYKGKLMAHANTGDEFDRQLDQVVQEFGSLKGFLITRA